MPAALLVIVVVGGCTDAASQVSDTPVVSYATPDELHEAGEDATDIRGDLGAHAPLALVSSVQRPFALLPDRLVEIGTDGVDDVLRFDPPVVGAEVAYSSMGTAVTAVTWALGGLEERTRVLWIDPDVETLLDVPGNLPLVGVLPDGILLRSSLRSSKVSVLGWDGTIVGLGVDAFDAILVPDTSLLVMRESEQDPLRVLDIEAGRERAVDGLETDVTFVQAAASPTSSQIVLALTPADAGAASSAELWLIEGSPLAARPVLRLDDGDVVAGFSDDGQWVVLVTDGERFGSQLVGVRLEDGEVAPVDLPVDGTPLNWSRSVLTLQRLRPDG